MFNCSECDKGYSKQTSLNRHLQNHRKSKQYTCPTCHVAFYRRDLLSRHSRIHRSRPSSPAGSTIRQSHVQTRGNQDRQRCHTACIPCRGSRTKCDGSRPCLSCISAGKTCEYSRTINRISRAPLHSGPVAFPEPPPQRTSHQNEISSDNVIVEPTGLLGWGEQNRIARDQEATTHHFHHMTPDELASRDGLLLSPAASSEDAPSSRNESSMQQCETNSFNQSFQNAESRISDPNLSVGLIDPLLSDLASDTVAWPWLHENLFLQGEYPEIWPEIDEQAPINQDVSRNLAGVQHDFHNFDQTVHVSQSLSTSGSDFWQQHPDTALVQRTLESSHHISNRNHAHDAQSSETLATEQRRIVDEIVTQAAELGSFPDSKADRAAYWTFISAKVRDTFTLQNEQSQHSPHILQVFVDLYLQHFGPLWPLLSRQNLDSDVLHPLLYLTLTSIGAMYGGVQSAHFGTLMHCRLRQSLTTTGLDFGEIDDDLVWLGQARLLTQVAALYFGQSQAFSYAQHLGGILVAQARRMNLFKAPRCRSDDSSSESDRPTSERLTRWLYLEARRRLAFGILRAETYTSVLLGTRPLVSPEEIDLELPYADSTWRGAPLPPEIFLALVERDRASRLKQRFSDVVRIAFERDEAPSALDPHGHELLLFGLQQSVWRFSHDRGIFLRLTRNVESSSQLAYDGLDAIPVPPQISKHSTSAMGAGQSNLLPPHSLSEDHLRGSPKRMNDLQTDLDRLIVSLQRWKESLTFIRNAISLQQDRNSVLSSLLLYHLSYVRLQAPIEDMHYVSYRIADKRPVEKQIIEDMCEWANSRRAVVTVQHACIIWSLINREVRRPEGTRAQFNFLAFTGLHHAAVALWTFMGARNGLESQEAWSIEPLLDSEPKLAVNRSHSRAILVLFSQVFNLVGPGRWSSFSAAALKLSDCQFPQPEYNEHV